ncbi:MAG TPA: HAMP domain-containing sensor histidine kinase [Anaeromyxobacteraceae bacterium]|nr:HAMP domain-containing sensor histidine kinase [Anaeromyxobacteraceae bacterium]
MSAPRPTPRALRRLKRGAVVAACVAGYVAAFYPAWSVLGGDAGTLTIVPIVAAGWTFGVGAGIGAAVGSVLLTYGLLARVSPDPARILLENGIGIASSVAIGGATGWVRGGVARLRRQTRLLEQRHAQAQLEAGRREAAEEALRRANATLEKACDAAVRASDEKSRFLGRASHELRTPLAAIQGYAELLLEEEEATGAPPPTLARDLGRIIEASRHLTGLVDELLDISKIETGRLEVTLTPVDLRSLVEDVAAMMKPAASVAGTRLQVRCAGDVPTVRTDPRRARQILLNLLSNAIKFTGEGDVTVSATRAHEATDEWAEIEVRDTGPGMTAEEQQRAFDEFWRGQTDRPGVGLGLSIAQRLCVELGGAIAVHGAPGAGASFVVRLPVATARDVEAAALAQGAGGSVR